MFIQKAELKDCKKEIEALIRTKGCNPIIVRLAWHDSGSYDKVSLMLNEVVILA